MQQLQPGMLLTVSAVATWLSVRPRTIQRWLKEGGFPMPIRFKGQTRWRSDDLIAWSIEEVIKERVRQHVVSATLPAVPATFENQTEIPTSGKKRS